MSLTSKQVDEVFTPSSPVKPRFLVGRKQERSDLEQVFTSPGMHGLVIGHRGIGKTSLVKAVLNDTNRPFARISCLGKMSFDELFREAFGKLGIDVTTTEELDERTTQGQVKAGVGGVGGQLGHSNKHVTKRAGDGAATLTGSRVGELLSAEAPHAIIVLDEYDRVASNSSLHGSVASLIKTFSDEGADCDIKIIVVGVARAAKELLGVHTSIRRCLREVYLDRLRDQDIVDFLTETENYLGFRFDDPVKYRIATGSIGYPYYAHLVGSLSVKAMLERQKEERVVSAPDLSTGISRAVEMTFRAELRGFAEIEPTFTALERSILRQLSSMKTWPKRDTLCNMLARRDRITPGEFSAALLRLTQHYHVLYLKRTTDEVRFADPLMKPFLRDKIFQGQV